MWIPVHRSWRLNERHYGALQGLNKAETAAKYGEDAGEDLAPQLRHPAAAAHAEDPRHPSHDRRYARPEALQSCRSPSRSRTRSRGSCPTGMRRSRRISGPGKRVLIVAHGNSLRALVKYLDNISDDRDRRPEYPDRRPAGLLSSTRI